MTTVIIYKTNERGHYATTESGWEWVVAPADDKTDWLGAFPLKKYAIAWCKTKGLKVVKEAK